MLFDSHAHYNDERFKDDVDEVLSAMNENNVGLILNSCSSLDEVPDIFAICEKYPFVYASVGIHPHEVSELTEADMDKLKEYAKNPKVKAIGEIGLDYFYDFSPRDIQQKWFARQVDVARELKMPVVIHDREAHKDCMDILREHKVSEVGGVFHCYAGSVEMAKEILDWGMYIAFGGSLTFKKSVRPVEVAKYVPLDRIVIETDSPYLTPEPHRGKRNSSLYIHYVAEKLAAVKGISVEEIENATYENAKKCFGIKLYKRQITKSNLSFILFSCFRSRLVFNRIICGKNLAFEHISHITVYRMSNISVLTVRSSSAWHSNKQLFRTFNNLYVMDSKRIVKCNRCDSFHFSFAGYFFNSDVCNFHVFHHLPTNFTNLII